MRIIKSKLVMLGLASYVVAAGLLIPILGSATDGDSIIPDVVFFLSHMTGCQKVALVLGILLLVVGNVAFVLKGILLCRQQRQVAEEERIVMREE